MRPVTKRMDFDIAIVGSGFGGSLLAMIARRLGRSVILLEKGQHPRFAIGESSTPLANLLLEEFALRYELPRLLPLAKWGSWQKEYPSLGCGLKRGFTFFHHTPGLPWREMPRRENQLLVAASPHDRVADTHWYRPDFDHFLVCEAQAQGVVYLDQVTLEKPEFSGAGVTLRGQRAGATAQTWSARLLVDATGPRGFLHHALKLPEKTFPHLPPTQGLYSHFSGVRRWEDIRTSDPTPPYPVDDAAVHHVFEGGWLWVLRFNNGITSAGVAATAPWAHKLRLADGAPGWARLLEQLPSVREQFDGAKALFPFIHAPQLSFRSVAAAGQNWVLLPSAAGFVDPLLSTGFPLTLLGIGRLAEMLEQDWNSQRWTSRLERYELQTLQELDTAELMVAALYANLNDFTLFSALSLLYFAAASFTEVARRLGRPELAGNSFLLREHPNFGPQSCACLLRALTSLDTGEKKKLIAEIQKTIEPVNVAGLGDPSRHNWFPADASDLLKAAPKLGASKADIQVMLARCGLI